MATDIARIIRNLEAFYDFRGKTVLSIGAGGGQLIEYARTAARVIALDSSAEALDLLRGRLAGSGMEDKFSLLCGDLLASRQRADVAVFEFCLHEMPDATAAVAHACALAAEVVAMDHWPGSDWAFYVAEELKVARAWEALAAARPRRTQHYETTQAFRGYEELRLKVLAQGEVALRRIEPFRERRNFSIAMTYGFALL
jgi:SAM-dependent methyltransferase